MGDIESSSLLFTLLASSLGALVLFVSAFAIFQKPKTFNVPTVGLGDADSNTLKLRYVQEADVLLREGHQKVRTPSLSPTGILTWK